MVPRFGAPDGCMYLEASNAITVKANGKVSNRFFNKNNNQIIDSNL